MQKKTKNQNINFKQKILLLKQAKPYILPFAHKNLLISKYLAKSYGYLVLSKICFFGGPLFLKYGINTLHNGTIFDPILMFFGYGVCYSSSVMFESFRNIQTVKIVNIALAQKATQAYKHMLSLGPQFFFKSSQRHRLFNLYKAQTAIEQNLKALTQYFFPITLDIILSSAMLFYYSNSYFVLSFVLCYGLYAIFTIRYSQWRRIGIKNQRDAERNLDFIMSQTFANYYNVKYFQHEQKQIQRYLTAVNKYHSTSLTNQKSLGILNTTQRFIFGIGLTFNMMLAAYYTQLGFLTTGDIIMIQTLMMQFLNPMFFLGSMYRFFTDSLIDVRQLYNTLKIPCKVKAGKQKLENLSGQIQFHQVVFQYDENSPEILHKINFLIQSKSFVAIVGKSGIGKTTILNLIFRMYDPKNGYISLDNVNLKDLDFDFRNQIAFVSQNPYIFTGSVLENIRYGKETANMEEIINLTSRLGLHELIKELPQGYDTNVGEKGSIFSGGQKQRISLIRALLRKSKILLLDEPTSSLDIGSEQKIAQLLQQQTQCTRIMVTHRQSLLKYTDKIIYINKKNDNNI